MTPPIVNDLTFQAATVNGSGSQSANLVLTRAVFSMGIPVAPKNVFPSNIEGLPTWYQLRISPAGYQASKGDPDVLVALNPATWPADLGGVRSGAAVIHEEAYGLPANARDDVFYYPVPFARLAKTRITSETLRKQLTNMIYVGVVAALLGIPLDRIEHGLKRQFQTKPKAVPLNMEAVQVGFEHWHENFSKRDPFQLRPVSGGAPDLMLMEGNQACALGSLMGGVTVAAWYPITPSSSLCENLIGYAERYRTGVDGTSRIAVVQAEDELAAAGMAIGAAWAGARAMTSTSGPGISLMAEFAGLAYYSEVPIVIFDVQRVGPSTGLPTRTSQGDLAFTYQLSHGDTRHIVLLPGTVEECYEDARQAFDLADRFQTPVFVLSDLDLGMNLWMCAPFRYPEKPFDRGKVLSAGDLERIGGDWGRYRDPDGDGIPFRTLPGTPHPAAGYFTRGSGHDENAHYTEDPLLFSRNIERILRKHETARGWVPAPIVESAGHAIGLIAFGSTHHAVVEARDILAAGGLPVDYLRVRALPLNDAVEEFVNGHERVYVVEQNQSGQLHDLLRLELPAEAAARLRSIRHWDGRPIPARAITAPVMELEEAVPL
ncbi:MAG: 2-oxoacid:acceptor oxidoreductase subunit alpha [Candidatus Dormibacteraceae bacterium]